MQYPYWQFESYVNIYYIVVVPAANRIQTASSYWQSR